MRTNFENFDIDIFGASHSEQIGVTIKNLPIGISIDIDNIQKELDRRKAGNNIWSTPRREEDKVEIVQGLTQCKTDGKDFVAVIKNNDKKSKDYEYLKDTPRPSHADYAAKMKFGLDYDMVGGGKFSGRMTAPLVIAGSVAKQILSLHGIFIGGYVSAIADIKAPSFRDTVVTQSMLNNVRNSTFPVLSDNIKGLMEQAILIAKDNKESVGGSVDIVVYNTPVGLGDALLDSLEGKISYSLFAVPAVKAIEFGLGTAFSSKFGSEVNDQLYCENGNIGTLTNNNGGINGGISNGMPITIRVTVKPTPSIGIEQKTVNLRSKENTTITIKGRHDACIVPRAVAPLEASVALAILDAVLSRK